MGPQYDGYETAAARHLFASRFLASSTFLAYETAAPHPREMVPEFQLSLFAETADSKAAARRATPNVTQAICLSTNVGEIAARHIVFIADLGDARLALQSSLPIVVESAGNRWVAYSFDLDELAVADDEGEAIAEMKASLVESYFLLKQEQNALGPLQQRHWAFIRRLVREIP